MDVKGNKPRETRSVEINAIMAQLTSAELRCVHALAECLLNGHTDGPLTFDEDNLETCSSAYGEMCGAVVEVRKLPNKEALS